VESSANDLASPLWAERAEPLLVRFEQMWRAGGRPDVGEYAADGPPDFRPRLLRELVLIDLEMRLKAGEAARAEDYLQRFPDWAGDPANVRELVRAEFRLRVRQEAGLDPAEFAARFPGHDELVLGLGRDGPGAPRPTQHELAPGEPTLVGPGDAETARDAAGSFPPVPGYEVLKELGRGGMGVVYQARQTGLNRLVALKMVLAGRYAGPNDRRRFRTEAEVIARLRHPGIVQIHEVGEADGHPYFCMEYVEGGTLAGQKSCAPGRAAELVEALARAVHHAHTQGIIHRDLKPANVLLTADGQPKVTDFGLAKRLEGGGSLTQSGAILGTAGYMSPEQVGGNTKSVGPGCDVYALGAILYYLLTERPPFHADTPLEAILLSTHQDPTPPHLLRPSVPQDLEAICLKCLARPPALRYPSALALAEDLRRYQDGRPVTARPSGQVRRGWDWLRRLLPWARVAGPVPAPLVGGVQRRGRSYMVGVEPDPADRLTGTLEDRLRVGQVAVPGYKLVRFLGRGGYEEVWEAKGPGGVSCALKVVRNLDANRWRQEYRSLDLIRNLEHDRLINLRAYWLLTTDGAVIPDDLVGALGAPAPAALVAASDLAAKNLLDRWSECRVTGAAGIPVEELMSYLLQAAEGIDYVNARSIIHRDIKPENIYLTPDGRVKIGNLGLAKLVKGAADNVYQHEVGLTLAYAAPEMLRNTVTRWTDQYSLALTYYKLRTGLWPFPDDYGPIQMMNAHAEGRLDFTAVGEAERAVLARATAVEPTVRYATCQQMVDALAEAIGFARPTRPARIVGPRRRNWWQTAARAGRRCAVGAVGAAVLAAFGWLINLRGPGVDAAAIESEVHRLIEREDFEQARRKIQELDGGWHRFAREQLERELEQAQWEAANRGRGQPPEAVLVDPEAKRVAALRARTEADVAVDLGANRYAAAAQRVKDARAAGAGAEWADKQDTIIRGRWLTFADGRPTDPERLAEMRQLAKAYPDDAVVRTRVDDFEQKAGGGQLAVALDHVKAGRLKDARTALDEVAKQGPPPAIRARLDPLITAVTAAMTVEAQPAEVATLEELTRRLDAVGVEGPPEDRAALRDLYRGMLARKIQAAVPGLTADTPWDKLAAACRQAEPTPWVWACQAECAAELRLTNRPAGDLKAARAALGTIPEVQTPVTCYARYAAALLDGLRGEVLAAAALMRDAYPEESPAGALAAPHRVQRAVGAFAEAARRWRAQAGPTRPFRPEDVEAAYSCLVVAKRLAGRPGGVKPPPGWPTGLDLNLALAAWHKPARDERLAGQLAEQLAAGATLDTLRPAADAYAALVLHMTTRDETPAGRRAAAASAARALRLAGPKAAGVPTARVFADVVRPILDDGVDRSLAALNDPAAKAAAAELYVEAAEAIRADPRAWAEQPGVGDRPQELVLKLYDRAVRLHDRPRYGVRKAFAEIDLAAAPDLPRWRAAADRAVREEADYAGGYILQGVALLQEAKAGALADRVDQLRRADGRFAEALKRVPDRDDARREKAAVLLGRSNAALQLANSTFDRALIRTHLDAAVKFAKEASDLDGTLAQAWDALGCAYEDRAMLLGETAAYASAVEAFITANDISFGAYRTKPALDRGRCQYRWAEAAKDRARVDLALEDLGQVTALAPDTPAAMEALTFMAQARALKADLVRDEDPAAAGELARKASEDFRRAHELAGTLKSQVWAEVILYDWSVAELAEADTRIAKMAPPEKARAYTADREVARCVDTAAGHVPDLRRHSPARAALVEGRVTLIKRQPTLEKAIAAALEVFARGLESKRPEDQPVRVDILHESMLLRTEAKQYAAAFDDADRGYRLATETGRDPKVCAKFLIQSVRAKMLLVQLKPQEAADHRTEVIRRLRLAVKEFPDDEEVWLWQYTLADVLVKHEGDRAKPEAVKLLESSYKNAPERHRAWVKTLLDSFKAKPG
jgi:serine/threonine protein kinase